MSKFEMLKTGAGRGFARLSTGKASLALSLFLVCVGLVLPADEFVWQGKVDSVLSLDNPASYKVNGVAATSLPGEADTITLPPDSYAVVDNDTINVINGVLNVMLQSRSRIVFNVSTNASVTVPVSSYNLFTGVASALGTIEKNCESTLSFDALRTSYIFGGNKQHEEYLSERLKVNAGTLLVLNTNDDSYKKTIFQLGVLDVAESATLFLPQPGFCYIRGLEGSGLVTNDCSDAFTAPQIRVQHGPYTFSGTLASRRALDNFSVVGNQRFTGTTTTMRMNKFCVDAPAGGEGYVGLMSFGASISAVPTSIGSGGIQFTATKGSCHLEYLGEGESVGKTIYLFGGKGYPDVIDAGAHGGVTFSGQWYGGTALASFGAIHLVLTGSNTTTVTLSNHLRDSVLDNANNSNHVWYLENRPLSVTKRGTGRWNLGNVNRTFSGIVAVEEGTLGCYSIAERGTACSLGVATNCCESTTQYVPFMGTNMTDAVPVGYAIRLGDPTDPEKTGTLEYYGTAAAACSTRPIAVTGSGRLLSSSSEMDFAGVFPYRSGENTLTLDGARDDCVLRDVTNNVGNLSIVKKGTGTWTLLGDQTFSGDITVEDGTLQIGERYTWFTLNYRQNNTNATNWSSWKKHVRMSEFGLFDKNGVRCNTNLEYTAKTSNFSPLTLAPGQTEYRQATGAYHETGSYANDGPDKLFDGTTSTYHYVPAQAGASGMEDETTESTWIRVAMRLPEGVGDVTSFDMVPPSYSGNNGVYAPISWSVEGSVDGITWVTLYETNGLTASDYVSGKWLADGSSFSATAPHVGFPIKRATEGMTLEPAVRSVCVKQGATLNVAAADITVNKLVVDVAGMGTVKGVSLASSGTVDIVGDLPADGTVIPAELSGLAGYSSLASGWTFTRNGGTLVGYFAKFVDGGILVRRKGMAISIR